MVRSIEGKHPDYFEAVLQLRFCTKEIVDFVESEIERTKVSVAKVVDSKNGPDYYLSDNEVTKAIGKKLQQHFGGELLMTSSLHTKIDNKEKYRVTVLFRYPGFTKNDTVIYQGEEWVVRAMNKDIFLQNKHTGKKIHVRWKDMGSVKIE